MNLFMSASKINQFKVWGNTKVIATVFLSSLFLTSFSQQDSAVHPKDSVAAVKPAAVEYSVNSKGFLDDTLKIKKRFWRGAGELLLVEVIPWSYNYFVRDAEFAKISWESIGHNLKLSSWEWDDNNFKT